MSSTTDSFRILHVDDDQSVLDLTTAFLEQELDLPVTTVAETAPEVAVERITNLTFDCIISDYDMPDMDGLTFFDTVQEHDATVPFILYTGKGSEEIASQALNAGVTGYLQKGGSDQQYRLANRVQQVLEDHRTQKKADRYSTVLEALGYPIYVIDENGRFKFVNEPFAALTGYDVSTIIGSQPGLIKNQTGIEQAETELGSILSSEGPDTSQFEVEIIPKEGDSIRCRDHMAALPYDGDSFRGSVGILRDISTEHHRKQELDYRTQAMDEAPVGITMSDPSRPDNPLVYVNDSFEEITGYDREVVVGRNCRFLQGPETRAESVAELRRAIDAGEPTTVTLRNYRKDNELFWNRVTVAPLRNGDNEITRWVGFQEDVTDYKRRQQRLERQNARLEEFASVLSHDVRNPLAVAEGRVELLRDEIDSEHLDALGDAHDRIQTLVEDLLALLAEDEKPVELESLSLAETAQNCWGSLEAGNTSLSVETDQTIRADPRRFRRLLMNLLRNAIEHGGETVRIGTTDGGFYVSDDGPGIPPEKQDRVFNAGVTTSDRGTGFGLAIVEKFSDAHGWTVCVTESNTGGARFEITGVTSAG